MQILCYHWIETIFQPVRVAAGEKCNTVFRKPWYLFKYLLMPFGSANAPECFQRFKEWGLREFLDIFFRVSILHNDIL